MQPAHWMHLNKGKWQGHHILHILYQDVRRVENRKLLEAVSKL